MIHIAIIEDVREDSDNLKALIHGSLEAEVRQAFNKAEAESLLKGGKFDLVIMDIELGAGPKNRYAGLGLLSDIRANWPTIVVSGMPEDNLRGLALTLHAYDFIAKPVDERDLINKIEHALEWSRSDAGKDLTTQHGLPEGLTADPQRKNRYLWHGRPVPLTLTELSILQCLIEPPGTVVETRNLAKNLKSGMSNKAIATQLSNVRAKFRDVDPDFDRIDNEPGRGYRWKTST
ncbi:transcriptional regulator [Pandoraea horticolens]|uniref:Transcriptional regulator n=1 Tax=Pandoraea horticolens TaxID=2508298 RepID=A0A5E4R7P0_9BURK|nr:response regulator [Pandoraea horticolens]VVD59137.1 transcriptional regulator [Pandoraea horticolens]